MDNFDIMCTATLRPELLKKTFDTHCKYLFKDNIRKARLVLNLDVTGAPTDDPEEEVELINQVLNVTDIYDFRAVELNIEGEPSFPHAFHWCVKNLKSELVFNLEEDWEMLYDLDFEAMVELFKEDDGIAHLRLSAFRSEYDTLKNWNKFLTWNGKYYQVNYEDVGTVGWAGHPSLNRTKFLWQCCNYIDTEANPEKQIKGRRYPHIINEILYSYHYGSFHPQAAPQAIRDIGRQWMKENGWQKAGSKAFFTKWQRRAD